MSLPLLHSPAKILAELLITLESGTSPANPAEDWSIFVATEPDQPDNCLTIFDTSPKSDGRSMLDGEHWEHHGFQIRVRGKDFPSTFAKTELVENALNEGIYRDTVDLDGASYLVQCVAQTSRIRVGLDSPKTRRQLFTINGLISLTRET